MKIFSFVSFLFCFQNFNISLCSYLYVQLHWFLQAQNRLKSPRVGSSTLCPAQRLLCICVSDQAAVHLTSQLAISLSPATLQMPHINRINKMRVPSGSAWNDVCTVVYCAFYNMSFF